MKLKINKKIKLRGVMYIIGAGFVIIILVWFFTNSLLSSRLEHCLDISNFWIGVTVALALGIFTVGSYLVARRVEDIVRESFMGYEEFVKRVTRLLENPKKNSKIKIMVTFPYFELTEEMKTLRYTRRGRKMECNLNRKIENLYNKSINEGKEVKLIQESPQKQKEFLKSMDKVHELKHKCIKKGMNFINDSLIDKKEEEKCEIKDYGGSLPFHMAIVDKHAIFVSLPDKWENYVQNRACTGYETYDEDLVSSLEKVFKLVLKNSKESQKRNVPEENRPYLNDEESV